MWGRREKVALFTCWHRPSCVWTWPSVMIKAGENNSEVNFAPILHSNAHCVYLVVASWQQSGLGGAFACDRGQIYLHYSTHWFFRLFSKSSCLCAIPRMKNDGIQAHSGAAECCSAKYTVHCWTLVIIYQRGNTCEWACLFYTMSFYL